MFQYYLKLSWLSIKRTPMLTALMVLAIGLGIGVSMTVLTVNYLMAKDPIPEKSDQLFSVQLFTYDDSSENGETEDNFPWQLTYQDTMNISRSDIPLRKTRSLETALTVIPSSAELPPFIETTRAIDSDFFAMFNVPFIYGNTWDKEIDINASNVTVIGKELNDKLFRGENSVGKQVNYDSKLYTIVGVIDDWQPAPRFYDLPNSKFGDSEVLFVPFSLIPIHEFPITANSRSWKTEVINSYQDRLRSERLWTQFWVELPTTNKLSEFNNWLTGYIKQQQALNRFESKRAAASLKNVTQWMQYNKVVSDDSSVLVGLSFMFLAVCMINTIGLLLAKFLRRAPEVGVRRALGASKSEVFKQHLVDVGLIGVAGGLVGLALGQLGLLGVKSLYASYQQLVHMDTTLILSAIAIALSSSLVAGVYPAWLICQTNPSVYLKTQ